jgi:RNA polymerase sigma-70 factor (ECF subfamily)
MDAVKAGDLDGLLHLLTDDVTFAADGGGKASAVLNKLVSPIKVARLMLGLAAKGASLFTVATCEINGRLGVLLYNLEGVLDTAFSFDVVQDEADPSGSARIGNIYAMRNPDKLAHLAKSEEG